MILQVDHSKVTGWLAAHWGNQAFVRPEPLCYAVMVLAAQEHDTGWWDWEIKPQINSEGARSEIFEYSELFYHRKRLHQSLNYQTPMQCEVSTN